MNATELAREFFLRGMYADIQITTEGNPMGKDVVLLNPDIMDHTLLPEQIEEKFGKQNWTRLDFEGFMSCYCPVAISQEVRANKEKYHRMVEIFGHR